MANEQCEAWWFCTGSLGLECLTGCKGLPTGASHVAGCNHRSGCSEWAGRGLYSGQCFQRTDLHHKRGIVVVINIKPNQRARARQAAVLTTEMMVALGILVVAMMPLALSFVREHKVVRSSYQ